MSLVGRPLKVNFAYRQIASEIEAQIMNGTLKLGEQLPGEAELADLFGVTRSTIREGLRQLESDGLVRRPSPRRLEVTIPQIDMLTTRSSRAMGLMKVTFRELWQVAMVTEPLAAELAAEFATSDEIKALRETHAQLMLAKDNAAKTIELDTSFHCQIADIGKNRVLSLAREPGALLLYQGFTQVSLKVPQAVERQIVAHGNIVDAISSRNAVQARKWALRHIEDFWRGIQLAGLEDQTPMRTSEE